MNINYVPMGKNGFLVGVPTNEFLNDDFLVQMELAFGSTEIVLVNVTTTEVYNRKNVKVPDFSDGLIGTNWLTKVIK